MFRRILLAGPDEFRWRNWQVALQAIGGEIQFTDSGTECVSVAEWFRPDFLLLDAAIVWGGGDGVLAVLHERGLDQNLRVMLIASGCDAAVLYRISEFSIDDVLCHRPSVGELIGRVSRLSSCAADAELNFRVQDRPRMISETETLEIVEVRSCLGSSR